LWLQAVQQIEITALITYVLINQMRLLRVFITGCLLFSYSVGFALWTGKRLSLFLVPGTWPCASKCSGLQRNLQSSYQEIQSTAFLIIC